MGAIRIDEDVQVALYAGVITWAQAMEIRQLRKNAKAHFRSMVNARQSAIQHEDRGNEAKADAAAILGGSVPDLEPAE